MKVKTLIELKKEYNKTQEDYKRLSSIMTQWEQLQVREYLQERLDEINRLEKEGENEQELSVSNEQP